MRKTKMQKQQKSTDALLKTSKKKDIELNEKQLEKVSSGTRTGGGNVVGGWDLIANKVHA